MPVYDMKCPKCGKQSTEYDENKWQCLHCGNRFVYKEESPTYQSQTNVSIQGSSLFDVEPYDSGNERAIEEPHSNRHPLEDDPELKKLKNNRGCGIGCGLFLLVWMILSLSLAVADEDDGGPLAYIGMLVFFFLLILVCTIKTLGVQSKLDKRVAHFNEIEVVGWTTLCPSCKEEHSAFYEDDDDHTSGPVHCKSCGTQFMLLEGKAHVIRH